MKPMIISHDTCAPYSCCAMPTIASFVGTTPCAPSAPWSITPSGSKDAVTSVAPALTRRNPSVAFRAPPITAPMLLRSEMRPIAVIMPMRYAGTLRISLTRKRAIA